MSPRGRPPKQADEKRSQLIQLRMTQERVQQLDACASALGATRTAVLEHGLDLVRQELTENQEDTDK